MAWSATKRVGAALLGMGKSKNSVAKHLGVATSTIDVWMSNPDFQTFVDGLAEYHAECMRDLLEDGERKAVAALTELLVAEEVIKDKEGNITVLPNHEVRLKAAESLLNRMGRRGKPAEKLETATINYSDQAIRSALSDPGVRQWIKASGKDIAGLLGPPMAASQPREVEDYETIPSQEHPDGVAEG